MGLCLLKVLFLKKVFFYTAGLKLYFRWFLLWSQSPCDFLGAHLVSLTCLVAVFQCLLSR